MYYDQGLTDSAFGALIQVRNIDIISNNLANAATAGFKSDRLVFDDELSRQLATDQSQGNLLDTDNPLDVAIEGSGFFMVRTPDGDRLTRAGTFTMTANGDLTTLDGSPVLDSSSRPITLNPSGGQIYIDQKGGIYQNGQQAGSIGVVDAKDMSTLMKDGRTTFMAEGGVMPDTVPASDYHVTQGALEMSNVSIVKQMVGMISAQRSFESYQKAMHALQEIDLKAVNQVGKV